MSKVDILRDEYPGDEAWKRFADIVLAADKYQGVMYGPECELKFVCREIVNGSIDIDAWMKKEMPALDCRSIKDVLEQDLFGVQIVRSFLMRL